MPDKIFVQPDGKLAVFSTVSGTFVLADATDEEVTVRAVWMAAEAARLRVSNVIGRLRAGVPDTRNGLTWDQALEQNKTHGGDLHWDWEDK